MRKLLILLVVSLLGTGCAYIGDPAPYGEVGVGYQIDSMSDWHVRTDREWQCEDNFQAHFEVGLDWGDTRLGYHHQSWWSCGGPIGNGKPELYQDDIRITHTFGGKD